MGQDSRASDPIGAGRTVDQLIEAALRQARPAATARPGGLPLPEHVGPYRICRLLGAGGMGIVYEAEQECPIRRRVALKVIRAGLNTREVVARFEGERQALALMNHPNIARVFDAGATEEGWPYFVMEYVPGVRITEHCDQFSLSVHERLGLFAQVCQAVQHAHQRGIIHRDLKPSNVLVMVQDDKPLPKIIDFGVAKVLRRELTDRTLVTQTGRLIGTPLYMSPEQLELGDLEVDTRTDIYALGVLLYELLVATWPYRLTSQAVRNPYETQRVIREQEPTRPSARLGSLGEEAPDIAQDRDTTPGGLRRQLRGDLDWITMRALEKNRDRRYASAADLAADIQRRLRHEPVLAGPPSTVYVLRKFVRRNRALVVGAAAVGAVLIAGIVASMTFAFREARAQRVALWQAYLGSITGAHGALSANEVAAARRNLERAPARYRDWEWHYLQAESDQSLCALTGHDGPVWAVAFDPQRPDGSRFASAAENHTIRIWDLSTPAPPRVLNGHLDIVYTLAYSPDGRYLASGSSDKTVRIWDLATDREAAVLELGYVVFGVAFDPGGCRLTVCGSSSTARLFTFRGDAAGEVVGSVDLAAHPNAVYIVAFSPDGQRLASAGLDGTVRIWDAATGQALHVLEGHTGFVRCVAFSPDGTYLASGSKDGTVRLWDAGGGEALNVLRGHVGAVQSVAFSPDGLHLATAGDDSTVRIWDTHAGEELATLHGHAGFVQSVAFSPDGRRLASAGRQDQTVRVWDPFGPGRRRVLRLEGQAWCLAFSPDGSRLASAPRECRTPAVYVWDAYTGERLNVFELEHSPAALAFDPERRPEGLDDSGKALHVWGPGASEHQVITLSAKQPCAETRGMAFNRNGTRLVTDQDDGMISIWDAGTGAQLARWADQRAAAGHSRFGPDGTHVTRVVAKGVTVWDVGTDPPHLAGSVAFPAKSGRTSAAVLSPDSTRLAAGCGEDGAVFIWEMPTGKVLHVLRGHEAFVQTIAFTPDGYRLATGSEDGTVRIWDPATGEELLVLRGHEGFVHTVIFSPDGTMLASASADGTVRVWDSVPYRVRFRRR
jgi:WD40 repeat protein/serine/threonine protein kinase